MGGVQVDERGEIGVEHSYLFLRHSAKAKILVDLRHFEIVTL